MGAGQNSMRIYTSNLGAEKHDISLNTVGNQNVGGPMRFSYTMINLPWLEAWR
jgi:hypothetical protein